MEKNGLIHGSWVLICDSRKALFAYNAGDERAPNLKIADMLEHPDRPTHEQGTDKPGRTFASVGGRRSATEPTDFQRLSEEDFLGKVADTLDRKLVEHRIKDLILVAPAEVVGFLRKILSSPARKVLRSEIEKDYVRMSVPDIEHHLAKHLSAMTTHK